MPKKWVRDARRKAREEAYRSVSAETHAAIREEKRTERAPLPVYRCGPIRWRNAATVPAFLRSLLEWADEARAFIFSGEIDSDAITSPEAVAALAALRLSVTDWVVRASKVRVLAKHQDTFFLNSKFRENLFLVVTTRLTYVGTSSLETEHEIRVADPKSLRQHGDVVAVVAGTIIPINAASMAPVAMPAAAKEFLIANVLVPGVLPQRVEYPLPGSDAARGSHPMQVRKSDCDAFEHVNNCTALDFFTDALPLQLMRDVAFFSVEYPSALQAGESGIMNWQKWTEEKDTEQCWFWYCDLTTSAKPGQAAADRGGLKAMFTSFWPKDKSPGTDDAEEQDMSLPQPFSAYDEDDEEIEYIRSGDDVLDSKM